MEIVPIFIDLAIVVLTTGITYYLFSVLPSKRRIEALSERLIEFQVDLRESILEPAAKLKGTYELYEEKEPSKSNDETLVWSLIRINDWEQFFGAFRYLTLMDFYSKHYWQSRELMLLANSLVTDNRENIRLSVALSKLNAHIHHCTAILGSKAEGIWRIKAKKDFIKDKSDNELISLVVKSLEDVSETAKEINRIIDDILGKHSNSRSRQKKRLS